MAQVLYIFVSVVLNVGPSSCLALAGRGPVIDVGYMLNATSASAPIRVRSL